MSNLIEVLRMDVGIALFVDEFDQLPPIDVSASFHDTISTIDDVGSVDSSLFYYWHKETDQFVIDH